VEAEDALEIDDDELGLDDTALTHSGSAWPSFVDTDQYEWAALLRHINGF
jgi:hypothetical protein